MLIILILPLTINCVIVSMMIIASAWPRRMACRLRAIIVIIVDDTISNNDNNNNTSSSSSRSISNTDSNMVNDDTY